VTSCEKTPEVPRTEVYGVTWEELNGVRWDDFGHAEQQVTSRAKTPEVQEELNGVRWDRDTDCDRLAHGNAVTLAVMMRSWKGSWGWEYMPTSSKHHLLIIEVLPHIPLIGSTLCCSVMHPVKLTIRRFGGSS